MQVIEPVSTKKGAKKPVAVGKAKKEKESEKAGFPRDKNGNV